MKILLVDDARSVVQVMTSRLNSYGYEVVHAENGQKAVEVFPAVCPDLILMDIEMPVMNGFVATNQIRAIEATQEWAWTPIIFLTSSDTVQNLITAIEAGGDDFMSKFVPEPVLQAKMQAMSRIAGLRQRLAVANAKLQNIADHDGLTGLLNRRSMDRKVDHAWSTALHGGDSFGLLMLDIDNFKKYNDHYGHQAGDDCLKMVAKAVEYVAHSTNTQGLTANAFAARYGGEEFAVTIPGASYAAYEHVSHAIVQAVHDLSIPHEKNSEWGVTTISVGGTWLEAANGEIKQVFRLADEKLYMAKERGRNRAEV
ncbi:diguanylate cyclase response regulator [Rhodoferax lacus]|uniref:diguanylate cyclase n=1 Tax=Rhodoferax lacus TaxID=2184758 RepID=A0A3E1RAS9_9BURK|nr:diguanylate cyclase [Rhodoferax lacus]RFO96476.1 diguanylate cyclase response regulator [Rhodoferax lacus]